MQETRRPRCRTGTPSRPGVLVLALVTFLCQLALNAGARPGEIPRATFERLTGLTLAGVSGGAGTTDCGMPDMPGMASAMSSSPQKPGDHAHGAQHACALCLLLELAPLMMAEPVIIARSVSIAVQAAYQTPAIRGPPSRAVAAAFPRGPPILF